MKHQDLAELLEDFLTSKRFAQPTISGYRATLKQFWSLQPAVLPNSQVGQIIGSVKPGSVSQFLADLKKGGSAIQTQRRACSCLRSFFRFCLRRGLVTTNPVTRQTCEKQNRPATRIITEAELASVRGCFRDRPGLPAKRCQLIIELAYRLGLGSSQLSNLKTTDLDLVQRRLTIRLPRQYSERQWPLDDELVAIVGDYLALRQQQPLAESCLWLFLNRHGQSLTIRQLRRHFQLALRAAGLDETISLRTLRQSWVASRLRSGLTPREVGRAIGQIGVSLRVKHLDRRQPQAV